MEDNQNIVSIDIPEDKVEIIQTLLTGMSEGDRGIIEQAKEDITTITSYRKYMKDLDNPKYTPSVYMKDDEVDTAYKHALDVSGSTPEDCFNQVIEQHGVTKEYVDEAKDNPSYGVRKALDNNLDHKTVKLMDKNKVLDIKSLKRLTTPNQLINTITTRRTVSERLDALEHKVAELDSAMEDIKLKQLGSEIAIDNINTTLMGIELTKEKKKENCKYLKEQNYTIKQIATILSISESTVKRNIADKSILIEQTRTSNSLDSDTE